MLYAYSKADTAAITPAAVANFSGPTDMNDKNYFAHTSPTYGTASQMLKHFGYSFTSVGENIAHHATIEKSQAAFMSSDGHRRNILGSQWNKVGIGVWKDAQGFVYVTQLFVR